MSGLISNPGRGESPLQKNDGGARRTFKGSRYVNWYRLGFKYKKATVRVIAVTFRVFCLNFTDV